ncbi:MAG TPA: hypothetical protein VHN59_12120 [Chitinophagaceae bacterium]|nr:hypothetical protein [Chitinophagaceae bacterium]
MSTGHEEDKNKSQRTETRRLVRREGDKEIWEVTITEIIEDPDMVEPPPPSDRDDRFDGTREWLSFLCNAIQPTERVIACFFSIHQLNNGRYSVLFTGNWKFDPADMEWVFYADDKVQDSYLLPDSEYEDLNREDTLKKFAGQLKTFSKTEQFKQSFFEKLKAVATGFFQKEIVMIK